MSLYSTESADGIFIEGYGLFFPAKYMSKHICKNISKNLSGKYSQKLLDHTKQSTTDELKAASKRAIKKISRSK